MATQANHCGNCAYFDEHRGNGAPTAGDDGLCRFNPPVSQPGPDAHGLWPVVTEQDWCGHYAAQSRDTMVAAE